MKIIKVIKKSDTAKKTIKKNDGDEGDIVEVFRVTMKDGEVGVGLKFKGQTAKLTKNMAMIVSEHIKNMIK